MTGNYILISAMNYIIFCMYKYIYNKREYTKLQQLEFTKVEYSPTYV